MDKRYYWIKLKHSFYESNEAIDFLLSQPDGHGAEYVVLYQMLCLKTANNNGGLYSQMGEMIVPYDVEKIVRDCKYFERDIVTNALGHYKKLGLIYEEKDGGYLVISNINEMVGSETDSAERKRRQRNKEKAGQCHKNVTKKVTTDIEKELDLDIEIKRENIKEKKRAAQSSAAHTQTDRFIKPTLEEVEAYCRERGNEVDAQRFIDYYTANGWKVGKNPMRDWKAAVRTWEMRDKGRSDQRGKHGSSTYDCLKQLYNECQEEGDLYGEKNGSKAYN